MVLLNPQAAPQAVLPSLVISLIAIDGADFIQQGRHLRAIGAARLLVHLDRFLQRRHSFFGEAVLVPSHCQPMHPLRHAQRIRMRQSGAQADGLLLHLLQGREVLLVREHVRQSVQAVHVFVAIGSRRRNLNGRPDRRLRSSQLSIQIGCVTRARRSPLRVRQFQPEANALFRWSLATVRLFHGHGQVAQSFAEVAGLQMTFGLGTMPVPIQRPRLRFLPGGTHTRKRPL